MGHTVLAVPVPALDAVVRERTAYYDASFVSDDPGFAHAHITVLGPWVSEPSDADLATVGSVIAETGPFTFRLDEIGEFPDGVIYLRPEPDEPFRKLTSRLAEAFPAFPPYQGRFGGGLVPHLTLDRRSAETTPESVRASLAGRVPVTSVADRVDLQWWGNHECRRLRSWPLLRFSRAPSPVARTAGGRGRRARRLRRIPRHAGGSRSCRLVYQVPGPAAAS